MEGAGCAQARSWRTVHSPASVHWRNDKDKGEQPAKAKGHYPGSPEGPGLLWASDPCKAALHTFQTQGLGRDILTGPWRPSTCQGDLLRIWSASPLARWAAPETGEGVLGTVQKPPLPAAL